MHLVIGLSNGGAETMLYNLLLFQQDSEIVHSIVSFGKNNQFWENEIRKLGIGLIVLDLKRRPIQSLYNAYRQIKYCDVLNCWLYHCNFIGYYLGRLAKVPRILWNVRHSNLDKKYNKKATIINGDLKSILKQLEEININKLYVDGGRTIQSFLNEDLLDEMIITTISIILGNGIQLFGRLEKEIEYDLYKTERIDDYMVKNYYRKRNRTNASTL